jgi:hypothetical protein
MSLAYTTRTIDEMAHDRGQIATMAPLPDGYRYAWLKRAEIPALIDCIARWHPDIAVGGGSCYLREDFYTDKVCLEGEEDKTNPGRTCSSAAMCSWACGPGSRSRTR